MNKRSGRMHLLILVCSLFLPANRCFAAPPKTAKDVFLALCQAAGQKDLALFKSLYAQSFKDQMKGVPPEGQDKFFMLYMAALPPAPKITSESVKGGRTVFKGTGQSVLGETTGETVFVKEGDEWRVESSKWDRPGSDYVMTENQRRALKATADQKRDAAVREQFRQMTDRLKARDTSLEERKTLASSLVAFPKKNGSGLEKPFIAEALKEIDQRKSDPVPGDDEIKKILLGN